MQKHEKTGKSYMYHEKHGAWVILRDFGSVSLTGGSHFEPIHFETELELINYLNKRGVKC